ncbi:MAG: 6,7-dimethyl-8-ribityllumazine synthase [Saprospiraceae bacterium]|nr:6,7-dimethyl-8-ribityllumazine synthase [Saprospiraceae bacterium]
MAGNLPGHSGLTPQEINDAWHFRYGIAVALWNEHITGKLLEACLDTLKGCGVTEANIVIQKVPGSFELPLSAKYLLDQELVDAVICLGCIIKGETDHDLYIAQAVAQGLMTLNLTHGNPVIFGVLTVLSENQAQERAGGALGNKGEEAAVTAIKMLILKNSNP